MADLLTVYEDDQANDFIDCTICNKRIRGDTHYKIHLTSAPHLKKEEAQAAKGLILRPPPLPEWTDIRQYLEYLQLDEPIIGLGSLVQEDEVAEDGTLQIKLRCKMCSVECDMIKMVCHVISRKHRQKYMQLKRPDLVTWQGNLDNGQKQPGLVARAKAAVVEKQEGWGNPVVLSRPNWDKTVKRNNQGRGTAEGSRSYTHDRSYSGRDRRGQSPLTEDRYPRSYLQDDEDFGYLFHYENDLYDGSSSENPSHLQFFPERDLGETFDQGGRQRPYRDDNQAERPYLKDDFNVRSFLEDDPRRVIPGRSHHDQPQDEYYTEMNPRRGWNSGGDVVDDPRNRFTDTEMSGSARRPTDMYYEEDRRIQDQMYPSHERRGHSVNEFQRPGRREHIQDVERPAGAWSSGAQDYDHRRQVGLGDYAQEPDPAKRKRRSRFSDASPLEIAHAQKRLIEAVIPRKNPRGEEAPKKARVLDSDLSHATPKTDNVLNVLSDIRIENMEEADFLKQKLCGVLKEFQENRAQRAEVYHSVRDYNHGSDQHEARRFDDSGFQGAARYRRDLSSEQRTLPNDPAGLPGASRFEESFRDFQDTDRRHAKDMMEFEEGYQKSTRYENRPRGFETSSRAGHVEDSRSFQNTREMRRSAEDRDYRVQTNRREEEGRSSKGDFRHSQGNHGTQQEYGWDAQMGGSERSNRKDYRLHTECYREDYWKPTSLREEERAYDNGRGQRPHYQSVYESGAEPYDPFHPSSSPPQKVAPSSSLDKIASTLLELVARK